MAAGRGSRVVTPERFATGMTFDRVWASAAIAEMLSGMPPFGTRRTHHAHVRTPEDAWTALLFCEHLRRRPEEAGRHAALKRELSAPYPTDREDDIERKAVNR